MFNLKISTKFYSLWPYFSVPFLVFSLPELLICSKKASKIIQSFVSLFSAITLFENSFTSTFSRKTTLFLFDTHFLRKFWKGSTVSFKLSRIMLLQSSIRFGWLHQERWESFRDFAFLQICVVNRSDQINIQSSGLCQ